MTISSLTKATQHNILLLYNVIIIIRSTCIEEMVVISCKSHEILIQSQHLRTGGTIVASCIVLIIQCIKLMLTSHTS